MALNYGNPFDDEHYTPYEWFRFKMGLDVINQPLISQVNAIGALWGKNVWQRKNRSLMMGVFQHFDWRTVCQRSGIGSQSFRLHEAGQEGL